MGRRSSRRQLENKFLNSCWRGIDHGQGMRLALSEEELIVFSTLQR